MPCHHIYLEAFQDNLYYVQRPFTLKHFYYGAFEMAFRARKWYNMMFSLQLLIVVSEGMNVMPTKSMFLSNNCASTSSNRKGLLLTYCWYRICLGLVFIWILYATHIQCSFDFDISSAVSGFFDCKNGVACTTSTIIESTSLTPFSSESICGWMRKQKWRNSHS